MAASLSKNDKIMQELISSGYLYGTISDRERKRLEAAVPILPGDLPKEKMSLYDLYIRCGERPRLP